MQNGNVVNCFEIAKFIVEIMLTIAAVVISIIALVQTKKQITLSNKQHLFDRRLEKYTIIEDILIQFDCINKLKVDFSSKDELDTCAKTLLKLFYDCLLLKDAKWTIDKLTDSSDCDANYVFLTQCSKLSVLSKEITIIFNDEESNIVSEFIENYAMLVLTIYHYYTLTNIVSEEKDRWIKKTDDRNHRLQILYKSITDNNIMDILLAETKL